MADDLSYEDAVDACNRYFRVRWRWVERNDSDWREHQICQLCILWTWEDLKQHRQLVWEYLSLGAPRCDAASHYHNMEKLRHGPEDYYRRRAGLAQLRSHSRV